MKNSFYGLQTRNGWLRYDSSLPHKLNGHWNIVYGPQVMDTLLYNSDQ